MATGRVPTTANSPLTAKGDLFGYSTAPARLAVGNNGESLVADSSTSTGLRYQGSMEAGKNTIINGNFDIWQRGTSFTTAGYTCDRWYGAWTGTVTVSRQTSGAPVGSQYYVRHLSGANNSIVDFIQFIETPNVVAIQGKTVVLSFKLRRNATLVSDFAYYVQKSATVDAGTGATWTTVQTGTFANASIPTGTTINDWYSASASFTIPTDGTANSIRIVLEPAAQMPNGASYDLAQVQLEIGSVATTFTRAGGSIQGELAACQRYFEAQTGLAGGNDQSLGNGFVVTATTVLGTIYFENKRTLPTATLNAGNIEAVVFNNGVLPITNVVFAGYGLMSNKSCSVQGDVTSTTVGYACFIRGGNANYTIWIDAEL